MVYYRKGNLAIIDHGNLVQYKTNQYSATDLLPAIFASIKYSWEDNLNHYLQIKGSACLETVARY